MSPREQILQAALALPPEDRVFLADELEQSLSGREFASPEIAAAWNYEIESRLVAFDRGEMLAVNPNAAIERARKCLTDHRAEKK